MTFDISTILENDYEKQTITSNVEIKHSVQLNNAAQSFHHQTLICTCITNYFSGLTIYITLIFCVLGIQL